MKRDRLSEGYDQVVGTTQQVLGEATDAYHEALDTAERRYAEARDAAERAYHDAQAKADTMIAQAQELYDQAAKRGRAYGKSVSRYATDNKSLALLVAGSVGFLLAVALKRRPQN